MPSPEPTPAAEVEVQAEVQAVEEAAPEPESEPPAIIFRCSRSFSAPTEPLYIIDGVIMAGGGVLMDLDPDDIESIEVVKGAAAAPLYGSRAANGVIIITTRDPTHRSARR